MAFKVQTVNTTLMNVPPPPVVTVESAMTWSMTLSAHVLLEQWVHCVRSMLTSVMRELVTTMDCVKVRFDQLLICLLFSVGLGFPVN